MRRLFDPCNSFAGREKRDAIIAGLLGCLCIAWLVYAAITSNRNLWAPVAMFFPLFNLFLLWKQHQVGFMALRPNTRREPLFWPLLIPALVLLIPLVIAVLLNRPTLGSICLIPLIAALTVLGLRGVSMWLAVAGDRLPPELQYRPKVAGNLQ